MRTSASDTSGMTAAGAQFPTGSAESTRKGDEKGEDFESQVALLLRAIKPASEWAEKRAELTPVEKRKSRRHDAEAAADASPLGMQWGTLVADQAKVDVAARNAKELRTRGEASEATTPPEQARASASRGRGETRDRDGAAGKSGEKSLETGHSSDAGVRVAAPAAMSKQSMGQVAAAQMTPDARAKIASGPATQAVHAGARNSGAEARGAVAAQPGVGKPGERAQQPAVVAGVGGVKAGRGDAFKQLMQAAQPTRRAVEGQQVAQVALRAMGMALKEGGGEVVMKLAPEALGQVKVHLQVRDAAVDAVFTTSTGAARQLLEARTDSLREALEARGLRVDSIVVEGPSTDAGPVLQQTPARAQDAHGPANHQGGALGGATDGGMHNGAGGGERQQRHEAAQDARHVEAEAAAMTLWDVAPAAAVTATGLEWVA